MRAPVVSPNTLLTDAPLAFGQQQRHPEPPLRHVPHLLRSHNYPAFKTVVRAPARCRPIGCASRRLCRRHLHDDVHGLSRARLWLRRALGAGVGRGGGGTGRPSCGVTPVGGGREPGGERAALCGSIPFHPPTGRPRHSTPTPCAGTVAACCHPKRPRPNS